MAQTTEAKPPMWIIPVILVVAAVLAALAYLAQRSLPAGSDPTAISPSAPTSANRPAAASPWTLRGDAEPAAALGVHDAMNADRMVPPPPHPAKAAVASHPAQKRSVAPAPAASAPVVSVVPERVAAPPAPEALPPEREAPAPNRWQVMADQINRCGRDGFFAGVVCEQKVRLKYCEGYWGQVPQCATGVTNDHGQ